MLRRHISSLFCVLGVLSLPVAACADDAAPVGEAPPAAAAPIATPDTAAQKPLLVIRFNQPRVYFDRVLRQAVTASEHAKHSVNYDIVSYMPEGSNKARTQGMQATDAANVNAIVQQMNAMGVESSRIHVANMTAQPGMTSQEVRIFVK